MPSTEQIAGVSGVAHVASNTTFDSDPNKVIPEVLAGLNVSVYFAAYFIFIWTTENYQGLQKPTTLEISFPALHLPYGKTMVLFFSRGSSHPLLEDPGTKDLSTLPLPKLPQKRFPTRNSQSIQLLGTRQLSKQHGHLHHMKPNEHGLCTDRVKLRQKRLFGNSRKNRSLVLS
jgi:hypothetical protein